MEPVGRIPCCRGVVIISVTGWGIKCLNMEILKETLSKGCTGVIRILTGFSMPPLGWNTLSTVSPVILEQSNVEVNTEDNQQCPI